MGAFLTTSLLTKFSLAKSILDLNDEGFEANYEKLLSEFISADVNTFNIYEQDSGLIFEVKEEILEEELIPFLKVFYQDFYGEDEECKLIIESIEQMGNAKDWHKLAEDCKYANFQANNYGFVDIYQGQNRISISYDSIILAMEEKIMMESYGKHFSFFESLIKKAYSAYKLSNLMLINISG